MSLHQEAGRLLGEQAAVPHDPHHVGVPRLLDVVGGDDDADTLTDFWLRQELKESQSLSV